MTPPNDQSRPARFRAEALRRAVEGFVRAFDGSGGPEQLSALVSGKRFRRAVLGEDPRALAAEGLVRPRLGALGYAAPTADPAPDRARFRPHPGTLPETEVAGTPSAEAVDYELWTADPALSGVVAVAAPNAERPAQGAGPRAAARSGGGRLSTASAGPATAAVRAYLGSDAVAASLRERDVPAAVGVATDGLRWSAWARPGGGDVRRVDGVTVKGVVEVVADAVVLDAAPPERWRVHARPDLAGTLAALASAGTLPRRALAAVDGATGATVDGDTGP